MADDFNRRANRRVIYSVYGIPIDRIIGVELKREPRMEGGRLMVWRLPDIERINDKRGKPVGIDRHIGKRPIFVAGAIGNFGDLEEN